MLHKVSQTRIKELAGFIDYHTNEIIEEYHRLPDNNEEKIIDEYVRSIKIGVLGLKVFLDENKEKWRKINHK